MRFGYFNYPMPVNEPVHSYAPGSAEREALKKALKEMKKEELDIPMYIGSREVRSGNRVSIHPPHEIAHTLGHYHAGTEQHIHEAIDAALAARKGWAELSWENRANIFLKAADLISGKYRYMMNAS